MEGITFFDILTHCFKELDEKGYTIIPNVISQDKAREYHDAFWDMMEELNPDIKRDKRSTWKTENWPLNLHGILQQYRVGHRQFVWDIRSEGKVIEVFKWIWGTEELLVSFDGLCLIRPTGRKSKAWPHVDQSPQSEGFQCAQGFINLHECGPHDGGLIVLEGSHKLHYQFFKEMGKLNHKDDWYKFSDEEMIFFKDCPRKKICCQPGDLVLWDSRTIHYTCNPTSDQYRMVVYVCMAPAEYASKEVLEKKKQAFHELRMTSHWPFKIQMFPTTPRFYNDQQRLLHAKIMKNVEKMKPPVLFERAQKLAGLIPY